MTSRIIRSAFIVAFAAVAAWSPAVFAQGRGGSRGGSGGGVPTVETRSRLEILTDALTLDKDQKKAVRDLLDGAYKSAAPIRAELKRARAALGAAVIGGKPQADIDAAAKDYATQVAAMTEIEMRALAQLLTPLKAEQRAVGTMPAFYLMRGMFLDDKKWDEIPEIREY